MGEEGGSAPAPSGGGGQGGGAAGAANGHAGGGGGAHGAEPASVNGGAGHGNGHATADNNPPPIKVEKVSTVTADEEYPISPRCHTPNPFSRKNTHLDLDDYFVSEQTLRECGTQTVTNTSLVGTERYLKTFEMATLPPNAWFHHPQDGRASTFCRSMVNLDYCNQSLD